MKSNSAERLNELMEYFGIKQADIVKKTGIPKSAFSMYIRGQRKPRQDKLTIIAEAYNVQEAWLLGYNVPMFKGSEKSDVEFGTIVEKLFSTDGDKLEKLIRIFDQLDDETRNAYILIGEKMLVNERRED